MELNYTSLPRSSFDEVLSAFLTTLKKIYQDVPSHLKLECNLRSRYAILAAVLDVRANLQVANAPEQTAPGSASDKDGALQVFAMGSSAINSMLEKILRNYVNCCSPQHTMKIYILLTNLNVAAQQVANIALSRKLDVTDQCVQDIASPSVPPTQPPLLLPSHPFAPGEHLRLITDTIPPQSSQAANVTLKRPFRLS